MSTLTLSMTAKIYHRYQSAADNELVASTGKLAGRAPRNIAVSMFPKVKAFLGRLADDRSGIEFTTEVPPDDGCPPGLAYWSEGQPGVEVLERNELVAIPVTIIKRND
ncbi:MAG TPA: hypothetical protein VGF48_26100 [Thermoanaerobaculia bacterium]|jgi:hypothetical protein